MIKWFCCCLVVCLPCQALAAGLNVAAAASLQPLFASLVKAYGQGDVQGVFGSSGKLFTQIVQGAPYHLFLSADTDYPGRLHDQGHTLSPPRVYARGELVLWSGEKRDLRDWQGWLLSPGVRHLAVADPQLAPYGREAVGVLARLGLLPGVEAKLVYGESVSQTNQFIISGAAQAGLTAKSVVVAPEMANHGTWVDLPPGSHEPIAQAAVLLRHANGVVEAERFFAFLFSPEAAALFHEYGYLPP